MSALSRDASQGLDSKQDHFESDSEIHREFMTAAAMWIMAAKL
jgi:hypothetical protein